MKTESEQQVHISGYLLTGTMHSTVTEINKYDAKSDKLTATGASFGNPSGCMTTLAYDDLGRVKTRNSHGGNIRTSYTYDLHGWLTGLTATKANGSRLFQEDIHYADNSNSAINCYNGNISMVRWLSGDNPMGLDICNGYTYTYDGLNRLTKAAFGMCPVSVPGLSTNNDMGTVQYTYNANSSPTSLTRYGKKDVGYGIIDQLAYQYKGNQLKTITDTGSALHYDGAFEFSDANKAKLTQKVYDYDACGSMTYDPNRGITKIEYDLLGNPVRVQFCNGNVTEYVYSAAGARLQTTHKTAVSGISVAAGKTRTLTSKETLSSDVTYYMGNFVYTKYGLQYHFADGYNDGTADGYHYYIRDHQGNNRVVAKYDGTIEQTTHYYPYGGILSQSTNQGFQKYKYNGKEFDTMHGLNMYDYGARQQDPAVGMFTSMDPLCEKYYNISPYMYCAGNPIRYVDPDGRKPRIYIETQGLGHTFVTIGEGKNTIVYTYGRYGALGSSGSVLHSFTPTGEGILLKKSGAKAMKYLADEAKKDGFSIFEIENATDADVASYFDNLWNKGDQSTVDKDPDARVIDEYNLLQNNCTTKAIQGINGYKETEIIPSETKVTHYTLEGYPHSGTERIFIPSSLKQELKEISTQHPKEIIYVTNPKQFIQNLQQVLK